MKNLLNLPRWRAAYSDRTAWLMAECSRVAYFHFKAHGLKALRLVPISYYGGPDRNEAYLATNAEFAVLAFKGTVPSEAQTVETDLNVEFIQRRYGEVHEGFFDAFESMRPGIERDLRKISLPVFVAGHSLGGALALIASVFLKDQEQLAACYTYGCPRVGDDRFVDRLFKTPVYRCVHHADIVPSLPLLGMGYRHYGDLRYLEDNGNVCGGSVADGKRLHVILNPFNWPGCVADHAIERYCEILREYAEKRNP
jgi:predicted lipase